MISIERGFTPEPPTKDEVIKIFKETGESSEAIGAYSLWFKEKQKQADESKSAYSRLEFNIDVADLLIECDLILDAYTYLDDAWDMLENELSRVRESSMADELIRLNEKLSLVTAKIK